MNYFTLGIIGATRRSGRWLDEKVRSVAAPCHL